MVFSGKKRNGDTLVRDTKTKTPKATTEKEYLLNLRSARQRYKKYNEKRSYNLKVKATKAKYYEKNKDRTTKYYEKNKDQKKAYRIDYYKKKKHCNHPSQYICKKRPNNSDASPNCSAGKGLVKQIYLIRKSCR